MSTQNTLVLFTSDNGPWLPFRDHGGSSGPLREGKGTTWEGGVRTPAIFWWPGTVRPGVVTDIGSGLDLLPTAAALAGVALPLRAIRKGRYKAHFITSGAYGEGEPRTVHTPPLLFDLATDTGERVDIAAAHPEVVAELLKAAEEHRGSVMPTEPLFDATLPVSSSP